MDGEGENFQSIPLQRAIISQGLQGGIDTGFQRIIALAKANTDTNAEVFALVDLRADKFMGASKNPCLFCLI